MLSDPNVLRREAAECRRLLVDGVETEGAKRLLQDYAHRATLNAEQLEAAWEKIKRRRDINSAYREDLARRRV